MYSVIARTFGGPDVIDVVEVAEPDPGPNEVVVRVVAGALNPIDLSARAGRLNAAGLMTRRTDVPLGVDVAGHVVAVGRDVAGLRTGDAVVGLRDLLDAPGTHAELVVLDAAAVAPAPRSVDLVTASTLPLAALTADRSLGLSELRRGDSVLVTGATGAVGALVVQLAAARGITTVAAVRAESVERAAALGAHHVVDASADLTRTVRRIVPHGVDAVIDAAVLGMDAHGGLRAGGRFIALVRPFAPPPLRATTTVVQEVAADGARLAELSAMVDFGLLRLPDVEPLPLTAAATAHELLERGGRRARLVLAA